MNYKTMKKNAIMSHCKAMGKGGIRLPPIVAEGHGALSGLYCTVTFTSAVRVLSNVLIVGFQ
jgi:hypothetical protein